VETSDTSGTQVHQPPVAAIGIELVVDDLDRALELFGTLLGLPVVSSGPAALVAGRVAVLDAGTVAITLLEPADDGPGPLLPDRTPRLTQLILGVPDTADVAALAGRLVGAGLAIGSDGDRTCYVLPQEVAAMLGQHVAVVTTVVDVDGGPAPDPSAAEQGPGGP
jgi:catechol 2,3-dioxygenase-like lactoylglutathione lyase family enzyme